MIMRKRLLVAIWGTTISCLLTRVAADDSGNLGSGLGGDLGDVGIGLGIAGGVLLGLSILHGLFMLISQQRPVAAAFKKANFKAFKVWKFHHLFTLPTLGVFIAHAIYAYVLGYGGAYSWFVVFSWTGTGLLGATCIVGALFSKARGKWRAVLRIVHFSLIIAVIAMMGIHVMVCD